MRKVIEPVIAAGVLVVGTASMVFGQLGSGNLDSEVARLANVIEQRDAERGRLATEAEVLAEQGEALQERLKARSRALYRLSRAGMLPLAGGFEGLLAHLTRTQRLERMVASDVASVKQLEDRRRVLLRRSKSLAERAAQDKKRLAQLEQHRNWQQASDIGAVLATGSARPPSWPKNPWIGGGLRLAGGEPPAFAARKGRLRLPISGTVDVSDGQCIDGPCLEFVAASDAIVRSVAEGRVAFVDQYEEYGRIVIVDHGRDHFTVYGGLGSVDVESGDSLGAGARLGLVGAGSVLRFEVRQGTRALEPRAWLGL